MQLVSTEEKLFFLVRIPSKTFKSQLMNKYQLSKFTHLLYFLFQTSFWGIIHRRRKPLTHLKYKTFPRSLIFRNKGIIKIDLLGIQREGARGISRLESWVNVPWAQGARIKPFYNHDIGMSRSSHADPGLRVAFKYLNQCHCPVWRHLNVWMFECLMQFCTGRLIIKERTSHDTQTNAVFYR